MIYLAVNETCDVIIHSRNFWNNTGVFLESGNEYMIFVDPPDQRWTDGKLISKTVDANGFSHWLLNLFSFLKRMRSEKWFTLVGCIEKDEATNFKIGIKHDNYCPPKNGELVCYANDARKHYGNNSGSLKLTVKRVK